MESRPDTPAVFITYGGSRNVVLSFLPAWMRDRVIFAERVKIKGRISTEFPPPRNDKPEEDAQ